MDQDLEHLRLLSIFHYVVGGLSGLFACLPLIHFFFGLVMTVGGFGGAAAADEPELSILGFFGIFFMVFAGVFILTGWAFAICLIIAGRNLARRQRYMFCLVMGGVACIFMPFGTVLGVFTIIVLTRPSVKALFPPPVGAGVAAA